jgi:hypothetical protein
MKGASPHVAGVVACLAAALTFPLAASAEDPPASSGPAQSPPPSAPPTHAEDKTGTDPTHFTKTLVLFNEFRSLGDEAGYNEFAFRYTQPIEKVKLQLTLPLDATDVLGPTQGGFGDAGLKASFLPRLTPKFGLVLFLDTTYPTATKDTLGSGKYTASPGATFAFFFKRGEIIFAPSVQQKMSFAGVADRQDVNQTLVDLYLVWRPTLSSWITVDPQFVYDHESGSFFNQTEIEFGRLMFGGVSTYLRPGVGIGSDRPIDWNIEFGLKIVH